VWPIEGKSLPRLKGDNVAESSIAKLAADKAGVGMVLGGAVLISLVKSNCR